MIRETGPTNTDRASAAWMLVFVLVRPHVHIIGCMSDERQNLIMSPGKRFPAEIRPYTVPNLRFADPPECPFPEWSYAMKYSADET